MKKISIVIVFMLVAMLLVGVFSVQAADDQPDLTYLTMINRTDGPVSIQISADAYYYLTVGPGETKTFHVEKDMYDRNTYACGLSASGTLNMSSRVRLAFPDCMKGAANQGEPAMEKVSLFDTPYGKHYRYQDP